jgi:uncharacterized protein YfiM (DUF2279 family)
MCTIQSGTDVEAAWLKATCEPVVVLNRDWSAGVGADQLTGAVSLSAAGTSMSKTRAAPARAAEKGIRRDAAARLLDIEAITVKGVSDD